MNSQPSARQPNAFVDDLDDEGAATYLELRPGYPQEVVATLRAATAGTGCVADAHDVPVGAHFQLDPAANPLPRAHNASDRAKCAPGGQAGGSPALGNTAHRITAVDIGAGSGQFTRLLAESGMKTTAIEPSPAMRRVLERQPWVEETGTRVVDATAEATGLPPGEADLVTWAQCFHWLDAPRALAEAARILRPGGVAAAIWNQFDTNQPWVRRLTRIMRSGDVQERRRAPEFGAQFSEPHLTVTEWTDLQTSEQVLALARTRSSYLRSDAAGRAKMQANLHWYLYDHLGFYEGETIELPYRTSVWAAKNRGASLTRRALP